MSRGETGDRLNRLLEDISTETVLLHQAVADRLGLNLTDQKALGFLLDAGGPISAGGLATLTGLTTGAVTGVVDRLEKAGYVRRKRDPGDRRSVVLQVNLDKVKREVFPLFEGLEKRMSALAATYSRHDLEIITTFMERGLEVARKHRAALVDKSP